MSWQTHTVVGANTVWILHFASRAGFSQWEITSLHQILLLMFAGGVSALLPDIDAEDAKVFHIFAGILGLFGIMFRQHRGFCHSLLAVALVSGAGFFFLAGIDQALPVVVTLGYFSHVLIDGFTGKGVMYLFPSRRFYRLVPRAVTKLEPFIEFLLLLGGLFSLYIFWIHTVTLLP